jgi:HAD superfamily hydrolase (TIGR01509 family)
MNNMKDAIRLYNERTGRTLTPKAALIDMDGVLYDSMKYHALSWQTMMREVGLELDDNEFYYYEGMTGRHTIDLIFRRELHRGATVEEQTRLYKRKTELFVSLGKKEMMPGADRMLNTLRQAGIRRVLVTGSGQTSLLDAIEQDYPGIFLKGDLITAHDVVNGKPDPEPYLRGQERATVAPHEAIVIENAPLGVKAGHAAGSFTIAVATGPIPHEELYAAGADIVFPSMPDFAEHLPELLEACAELSTK